MNEHSNISVSPAKGGAIETHVQRPIGWLRGEIDRLFDDFAFPLARRGLFAFPHGEDALGPAMELIEKEGGYQLSVELPGMDEKDIDIEYGDGVLSISGEKRDESETKRAGYLLNERSYGSFRRQITLPADVDTESFDAKFRHGVLKLTMQKDEEAASRTRKITVG